MSKDFSAQGAKDENRPEGFRIFGLFEVVFDVLYLLSALVLSLLLLGSGSRAQAFAGLMGAVLLAGDSFHLIPRIRAILSSDRERFFAAMGRGKQITSITMTVFYLLFYHLGLMLVDPAPARGLTAAVWVLAALRIALCLAPQNGWLQPSAPLRWAVYRNIPFVLLGAAVAAVFVNAGSRFQALAPMGAAIALSFAFYLPVALFAGKYPRLGMLMLPKSCAYIWMLIMFLFM